MTRILAASIVWTVCMSAFVAAQIAPAGPQGGAPQPVPSPSSGQPAPPSSSQPAEVTKAPSEEEITVTGCFVAGSTPGVFLLQDARTAAQGSSEVGRNFVFSAPAGTVDLSRSVNHRITVTGTAENKVVAPPPAGQKVADKDLPVFSVHDAGAVGEACTAAK